MELGLDAEGFLEWRQRVAATRFRALVEERGVEAVVAWFAQADVAIESGLEGVTIPGDETGDRFSLSITSAGVGILQGRGEMLSLSQDDAQRILDELRPTAE